MWRLGCWWGPNGCYQSNVPLLLLYPDWDSIAPATSTAGHPHCLHAGGSVAGSVGRFAPRGRRHELLSLWGLRFSTEWTRLTWAAGWSPTGVAWTCNQWHVPGGRAFLHVSPEQPGGVPLVQHWLATSGMFLEDGPCIELQPGHV